MEKLGEILLKQGKLTKQQLDFSLSIHGQNKGAKLGSILLHYNLVNEEDIALAIAESLHWDFYNDLYSPDIKLIDELSIDFIAEKLIFPIINDPIPGIVMAFPSDTNTTEIIRKRCGHKIKFMVGAESGVRKAIETYVKEKHRISDEGKPLLTIDSIDTGAGKSWVLDLIENAITQQATDIHLEPTDLALEVRFRIDGELHFIESLPLSFKDAIANILIIKINMDTSEKLKPLDGRFTHSYLNKEVDIRVSHIPTIHGSAFVLRLLDKSRSAIPLSHLGFSQHQWGLLQKALEKPHGIHLITGPTGSGKTTTLYSILNYVKSLNVKIITIEDPVEIRFPLITQVQVNETRGITFSSAIRSFLRHDPDILFIGEIRDSETAQEAFRASITGHMVFSTLHTNTPVDAILRLRDLQVDNSSIAISLVSVTSQRLVRLLCPHCKISKKVSKNDVPEIYQKYFINDEQIVYVANKSGSCMKCIDGYWSRTVVSEVLLIDNLIRKMIDENRINNICELVENSNHYKTIFSDAGSLVAAGKTSLDEVAKILG